MSFALGILILIAIPIFFMIYKTWNTDYVAKGVIDDIPRHEGSVFNVIAIGALAYWILSENRK